MLNKKTRLLLLQSCWNGSKSDVAHSSPCKQLIQQFCTGLGVFISTSSQFAARSHMRTWEIFIKPLALSGDLDMRADYQSFTYVSVFEFIFKDPALRGEGILWQNTSRTMCTYPVPAQKQNLDHWKTKHDLGQNCSGQVFE